MSERPKTPFELANEFLVNSKPIELLREQGKKSPTLDDHITTEVVATQAGGNGKK